MAGAIVDFDPLRLSVFVQRLDGEPIARMPAYAEVVWSPDEPDVESDERFREALQRALALTDGSCANDDRCATGVERQVAVALVVALLRASRDALVTDFTRSIEFLAAALRATQQAAQRDSLLAIDPAGLRPLLEQGLRAAAERFGLATNPPVGPAERRTLAYPLGVLASDHVGYLSFDLERLPAPVRSAIRKAVNRLGSPQFEAITSIARESDVSMYVYPFGLASLRFDALAQRRFAEHAIVLRLELPLPPIPPEIANLGILAMQDPGLVDWRLSPASFATNPGALLGADGCETLLPANVALQEYTFHQVVGLRPGEVTLPVDPAASSRLRAGFVNEFRVRFLPIGHSLGQILYSFPLAPGESANFAVIDWTRRDSALRNEQTKFDESLVHELRRDRTISETVKASIDEWQRGGSVMGGTASSAGGALGTSGMGVAGGASSALGGAYSTSSGSRDIAADTVQRLSDNIVQNSNASRELFSTVVVQTAQAEQESVETRTIANYNHSHALTILYYEVLRHYRLVVEFVRRQPAVLTDIHGGIAYLVTNPDGSQRHDVWWPAIVENRAVIEAALLDEKHKAGLDALERREQRRRLADVAPPPAPVDPPPPQGPEFRYFVFEMRTGGIVVEAGEDEDLWIKANVDLTAPPWFHPLNNGQRISLPGAFFQKDHTNWFTARLEPPAPRTVAWGSIEAFFVSVDFPDDSGDTRASDISFSFIKVTGVDVNGGETILFEKDYAAGHLILDNDAGLFLPTRRPAPPPPARPQADIDDDVAIRALSEHLLNRRPHYERALRLGSMPAMRASELAGFGVGGGLSLLDVVENRPLEVLGAFVAYPCADPGWAQAIIGAYQVLELKDPEPRERLLTFPTRGVFAEAKLGHCNASEEIDNTRFWDWQQSPIPHWAPEIAPTQTVTPQFVPPQGLESTNMPASLLNIVNPPAAPDPHGMTAALTALATANIFRDMSGRAEVADLLKKLTEASVQIAGVAQKAAVPVSAPSTGGGASSGGASTPPAQQTPPGSSQPPAQAEAPRQQPQQTPEQREADHIENQQRKVQIGKELAPPQRKEINKAVTKELTKKPRKWRFNLTSEWSGPTIVEPMYAMYSGEALFDSLAADEGGIYLKDRLTSSVASWEVDEPSGNGKPTHLFVVAREIRPVSPTLKVSVPGVTVEGITLQAANYDLPLSTLGNTLPTELKATAQIQRDKVNPDDPVLNFQGKGLFDKRDIEVIFKVGGGVDLSGELTRAFEAGGTIEVLKLAASAALKAAVKTTLNGEAAIKGTFEIHYVKGYEVKHV